MIPWLEDILGEKSWLSGVVITCQHYHASDQDVSPDPPQRENPGQQQYHARAEQLGQLGLPGCDEALGGMGGASLTSEVPRVNMQKFSSEVGYATPPCFPQHEHLPR